MLGEFGDEGATDSNMQIRPHGCGGGLVDVRLYRHLGSASVETEAVATPANARAYTAAIRAGASDATVHALGRTAWGTTFYNDNVVTPSGAFDSLKAAILWDEP